MMSISQELKQDEKACPPEVFERFGDFPVSLIQGRVYGKIKGKTIAVAKLVWKCHLPNGNLAHRKQIYHKDRNKLNNTFENLTLWRTLCNKKH